MKRLFILGFLSLLILGAQAQMKVVGGSSKELSPEKMEQIKAALAKRKNNTKAANESVSSSKSYYTSFENTTQREGWDYEDPEGATFGWEFEWTNQDFVNAGMSAEAYAKTGSAMMGIIDNNPAVITPPNDPMDPLANAFIAYSPIFTFTQAGIYSISFWAKTAYSLDCDFLVAIFDANTFDLIEDGVFYGSEEPIYEWEFATAGVSVTAGTKYFILFAAWETSKAHMVLIDDFSVSKSPDCPTLITPTNNATSVPLTQNLTWNAASGATSYDIYFGTESTFDLVANVTTTSYTPANLQSNTKYYWVVVAKNSYGGESYCEIIREFTTANSSSNYQVTVGSGASCGTASLQGGGTSGSFAAGTSVTVVATPNGGTFANWAGSGVSGSTTATYTFTMPSSNVNLTANFTCTNPTYQLTVGANGSCGSVVIQGQGGTTANITAGTQVTVVATPNGGTFTNWTGSSSSNNATYTFTMPSSAVNLTATFNCSGPASYIFNVSAGTGGSVSGTTSGNYTAGTQISVQANPQSGYQFVGWTVNSASGGSNNPYTFSINQNTTLVANFTQIGTYSVMLMASPSSSCGTVKITSHGNGTTVSNLATNTPVTIEAIPVAGATFVNWTGTGVTLPSPTTAAQAFFIANSHVTLTANFTNCPSGVQETEITNINIYPNPITNILTIQTDRSYDITVSDISGRVVLQQKLTDEKSTVDFSNCPSGMYFIQFKNANEIKTVKVVKE